jgi:glycosyltransferase involved in cell wall biosynthesis
MNILHLYSDWKWTGPSEPVLNLCQGLKSQGLNIHLACLAAPLPISNIQHPTASQRTLPDKATAAGIPLLTLATPPKYLSIFYLKPHINTLSQYIGQNNGFDIIHTHSALDHYYASKLKQIFPTVKIIRTNHKGYPLESTWSNKSLMNNTLEGYIALSPKLLEADQKAFGLAPEKTAAIPSGINNHRFHRLHGLDQSQITQKTRNSLGIKQEDIILGIVARVQRHRRFHIIIEAMKQVATEMPNVKLVIVGRGTYYNELVTEPVKYLNLENNVIQAGYLPAPQSEAPRQAGRTNDYLDTLYTFDFGLFLVPGSDGSCRAALEMMASGKPLIVANRGILPEIVDNEQNGLSPLSGTACGLVIDDTTDNLAQAILKLAKDKGLRERLGQSAREKVAQQFTLERTVKLTQEFYLNITK